jgi:hypothetical protein
LLLVGLAAAFAAYIYEDPAFGLLVRALPVSSLVAEAFGGYAGYTAGRGLGFRWFFLGGALVGLVAMAVSHYASVMVNGPPARWGRSFFAMGLVWVSTWAMFTGGANIGKTILLRSGRGEQAEVLKILVSLAAAIAPVLSVSLLCLPETKRCFAPYGPDRGSGTLSADEKSSRRALERHRDEISTASSAAKTVPTLIVENSKSSTSVSTFICHTSSDSLAVRYRGLHVKGRFRWLRRACHIPSYAHGMHMQVLRCCASLTPI